MNSDLLLKIYLKVRKVKVKYPPSRNAYNANSYG